MAQLQWLITGQEAILIAEGSFSGTGLVHMTNGVFDSGAWPYEVNPSSVDQILVTNHAGTDTAAITAGLDVTYANSDFTVVGFNGKPLQTSVSPSGGQAWVWNSGAGQYQLQSVLTGTGPTGTGLWFQSSGALNSGAVTLTGDVSQGALSGNNLPLTVTGIQGHGVTLATGFLEWTGTAWSFATGASIFTAGGDLSGSATSQEVVGILNHALPSLSTGVLDWSGSAWQFVTTASIFTAGGDLSGSATSQEVVGILNKALPALPGSAQLLEYTGSAWTFVTGASIFTAGGDLSGTATSQEVIGLLNHALPSLTSGYLQWTGSAWALTTPSSVTWADDLVNSTNTAQYVSAISYSSSAAGGAVAINGTGTTFQVAANNTGFSLTQATQTSNVATAALSISTQGAFASATGSNQNAGTLNLDTGASVGSGVSSLYVGPTHAGNIYVGNTSTTGGISLITKGSNFSITGECGGTFVANIGNGSGDYLWLGAQGNNAACERLPTGNTFQASVTTPTWQQTALSSTSSASGSAGQNAVFAAQAGQAATGSGHNGGAGGWVLLEPGQGGTSGSANPGNPGVVEITGTSGNPYVLLGDYSVTGNSNAYAAIWFKQSSLTGSNYSFLSDGSSTWLSAPSSSGQVLVRIANANPYFTLGTTNSHGRWDLYDSASTSPQATIANYAIASGGSSIYSAIWFLQSTPATGNYSFLGDGANTYFNAPSGTMFFCFAGGATYEATTSNFFPTSGGTIALGNASDYWSNTYSGTFLFPAGLGTHGLVGWSGAAPSGAGQDVYATAQNAVASGTSNGGNFWVMSGGANGGTGIPGNVYASMGGATTHVWTPTGNAGTFQVTDSNGLQAVIGQYTAVSGGNASVSALWLGNGTSGITPSTSNYTLAVSSSVGITQLNAQSGSTIVFSINAGTKVEISTSDMYPASGNNTMTLGSTFTWTALYTGSTFITSSGILGNSTANTPFRHADSGSTVSIGTGGTTTLTAAQTAYPFIRLTSSSTTTSQVVVDFSNASNGAGNFWILDCTGITFGTSLGISVKNGTTTKAVTTASAPTGNMIIVCMNGTANVINWH